MLNKNAKNNSGFGYPVTQFSTSKKHRCPDLKDKTFYKEKMSQIDSEEIIAYELLIGALYCLMP